MRLVALLLVAVLHIWGADAVCKLLARDRIVEVQGSAPIDMRSSSHDDGQLASSQCYYSLSPSNQSVSLEVIWQSAHDSQNLRAYWQQRFHGKEEEAERGEARRPPREVTGAGEEAFWVYTGHGGVLYALGKARIVRVAIGGPGDEQAMTERARKLATSALTGVSALH